jgi:copper homeostasis protein
VTVPPTPLRFEVCTESADGVLAALEAGADRIELCADLASGGTTPAAGLVRWATTTAAGRLAVHVLIRPRAGNFSYTPAETNAMARDIAAARAAGADGIVLGALTPGGAVDRALCGRLIALARPASVTFHRAFDVAADPAAAFSDVLALGADRLLTSGAAATAPEGADLLADLVRRAAGQVTILAGGGVTEATAAGLVRRTGVREFHFSARASGPPGLPLADRIRRIMDAAQAALAGQT